jgi:hypothetical protein
LAHLGQAISDRTVGNILRRHNLAPAPEGSRTTSFYEKVVKVKADVAAIHKFFLPMLRWSATRPRWYSIGGMRKGGFSGAV